MILFLTDVSFKINLCYFYRILPHKRSFTEGWCARFLGSDRSVVRRSQRYFYEKNSKRPVQIEIYIVIKSFLNLIIFAIFGAIFSILARLKFGRSLLLKVRILQCDVGA
jgi:hypothetical protein